MHKCCEAAIHASLILASVLMHLWSPARRNCNFVNAWSDQKQVVLARWVHLLPLVIGFLGGSPKLRNECVAENFGSCTPQFTTCHWIRKQRNKTKFAHIFFQNMAMFDCLGFNWITFQLSWHLILRVKVANIRGPHSLFFHGGGTRRTYLESA